MRARGLEGRPRIDAVRDLMTPKANGATSMVGVNGGLDSWYPGLDGPGILLAAVTMDV